MDERKIWADTKMRELLAANRPNARGHAVHITPVRGDSGRPMAVFIKLDGAGNGLYYNFQSRSGIWLDDYSNYTRRATFKQHFVITAFLETQFPNVDLITATVLPALSELVGAAGN